MRLTSQKRLAAQILKCSEKKIWIDPERVKDVKEAITKDSVRGLISGGVIKKKLDNESSRYRARKILVQKRKGRQKGHGSRKGKSNARASEKRTWINKIRVLRDFLKTMKQKNMVSVRDFRSLSNKAKGGFFRSRRHLKLYMNEHSMFEKDKK